ncbi:hypothetical protein TNCV_2433861 [Trichonephila clavipes]|nr:hypothetical protein TNCV_2433861 [Trichonephila clavipes]
MFCVQRQGGRIRVWYHSGECTLAAFIRHHHTGQSPAVMSPNNERSVAFSQRSSSPRLIEDETFNDSDTINNLIDNEDGQEEPDSLREDKNMQ